MSDNFEWQTGDESIWIDAEATTTGQRPGRGWLRPRFLAGLLVVIGILVLFARQSRGANEQARESILAAHERIYQADSRDDLTLLRTALTRNDLEWIDLFQTQFENGSVYDRPAFGLTARPDTIQVGELVFLPDTASYASLTYAQAYDVAQNGQTITLEHTDVYRQRGDEWLLSPPPAVFWGFWEQVNSGRITLSYPARDAEISHRLAADLRQNVGELCNQFPVLACPPNWHIRLRFSTKLNDSLNRSDLSAVLDRLYPSADSDDFSLRLPAPSLVGIPVDNAGYQALLDGYTAQLYMAIIVTRNGYECCSDGRFVAAALAWQLAQMDLTAWPWSPAPAPAATPLTLQNLSYNWDQSDLEAYPPLWQHYNLAQFLGEQDVSSIDMIRAASAHETWWLALNDLTAGRYPSPADFERAWLDWSQPELLAVVPVPDQDLQLLCQAAPVGSAIGSPVLFSYHFGDDAWQQEYAPGGAAASLLGLPGDDGVVIAAIADPTSDSPTGLHLWQDGLVTTLAVAGRALETVAFADDDRFLVYGRLDRQYAAFSLSTCRAGTACAYDAYAGFPVFSPGGAETILLVSAGSAGYEALSDHPMVLSSFAGEVIDFGRTPVWLSDTTFAVIGDAGRSVQTLSLPELAATDLLTIDDLPGDFIQTILQAPDDSNSLWLLTSDVHGLNLVVYDLRSRNFPRVSELDLTLDPSNKYAIDFSPTGRYLAIIGADPLYQVAEINLFDTENGDLLALRYDVWQSRPLHWSLDWSAGDAWLAVPDNGYIRLLHPATGRQSFVIPPAAACSGVAWVNR